ncbi:MAG TPA: hypothetical protein VMU17_00300 [Elusimicrobiota bacterium]|nr:hypothetical protein [Elusimicrobiota bacterium]
MDESPTIIDEPGGRPARRWPLIVAAAGVVAGAVVAGALVRQNPQARARKAEAAQLDQELDADQAALRSQKDVVVQLTQQLDTLKKQIDLQQVPDKAEAVKQYNQLATRQRAERDKYVAMATAYNVKVERSRDLQ